jgi:hypothetical protein
MEDFRDGPQSAAVLSCVLSAARETNHDHLDEIA